MIEPACGAVALACALAGALTVAGFDGWTAAEPDVQAVTPGQRGQGDGQRRHAPRPRPPRRDMEAPHHARSARCLVLAR